MTNNSRVTHATRNYSMKFGQVQKRIAENSCFVWVVYGESFRDATIAEAAQMRKAQPKPVDPIPFAELPSFHVEWTTVQQQTLARNGWNLLKQANQLFPKPEKRKAANRFCLEHA